MTIHEAVPSSGSFGLLAEFDSEESLVSAARRVHAAGYLAVDAFSPYPIDELEEALHLPKPRISLLVLVGGLTGAATAYFMQWYASVVGYPLNVGGRPYHSWPAFIPITFELTVLFAALFGAIGMFILNRLPQPHHPVFNVPQFSRASQDAFFLCIEASDPRYHRETTGRLLSDLNARGIWEVPR